MGEILQRNCTTYVYILEKVEKWREKKMYVTTTTFSLLLFWMDGLVAQSNHNKLLSHPSDFIAMSLSRYLAVRTYLSFLFT